MQYDQKRRKKPTITGKKAHIVISVWRGVVDEVSAHRTVEGAKKTVRKLKKEGHNPDDFDIVQEDITIED